MNDAFGASVEKEVTVRCSPLSNRANIRPQSEMPELLEDFTQVYQGGLRESSTGAHVIRMEVRKAGRTRFGSRMYQIFGNGQKLGGPRRRNEVFPFLEWGINSRVIATHTEFVQLHAATMLRGDNAVLFVGGSGSGKSTLAAGLLLRGWTYYCDEFSRPAAPQTAFGGFGHEK